MLPKHVLDLYRRGLIKPGDSLHWLYFESKNTPFELSRQDRIDRGEWTDDMYRPNHELALEVANDPILADRFAGGGPIDLEIAAERLSKRQSQKPIPDEREDLFISNTLGPRVSVGTTASSPSMLPLYAVINGMRSSYFGTKDKGPRSAAMGASEALKHHFVMDRIKKYDQEIESSATTYFVDPNLIRAIIYEEQAHLDPLGELQREKLGFGSTVGLGQVTVGYFGYDRDDLLDAATNIDAIAQLLDQIQNEPLIDDKKPITSIATRYNCGSCTTLTEYGRRVKYFYDTFFNK